MIALKSIKVSKNLLLGYWVILPAIFYFYLFLVSFDQQIAIQQLVLEIPGLALALLLSFLTLFQAASLHFITSRETDSDAVKKFLSFSMIQQILTGNIIGAALCFFVNKNFYDDQVEASQKNKMILYSAIGFISLISLIILLITIKMKGV
ncbi:hypothetical protein P7H74_13360 [Enterococcus devriesei]|uniref:hypothetical protein n=1 Tax=Enterococcus devriesei TaxID=319970 RepID=UPI00288EE4A0|nr:hypothetical protein [Enterococcus devriesei]MDT2822736.1 hypothetical protein [Enterococcus devriesei]